MLFFLSYRSCVEITQKMFTNKICYIDFIYNIIYLACQVHLLLMSVLVFLCQLLPQQRKYFSSNFLKKFSSLFSLRKYK